MKTSEMFQSKYLKQADVPSPIVATMAGVEMQDVGQDDKKETKAVLSFQGRIKPMVLNVENGTTLEELYGDDSDNWVGKQIEIYVNPDVKYGGKKVGGLRLRAAPSANGALTWANAIKQCAAVGLTEDDVRTALKHAGLTSYNPGRDASFIRTLIANAQGGGQGDEIPI
jgi:hypothetical protein